MYVIKRDGTKQPVKYDKITARIRQQARFLDRSAINPQMIAQMVITSLEDGMTTAQIDGLISETCHNMVTRHPDFDRLAVSVEISRMHKECPQTFLEAMKILAANTDPMGRPAPLVSTQLLSLAEKYAERIDAEINPDNDYEYSYLGLRTLTRSYLLKSNKKIIETPQYMLMRVSLGVHGDDIDSAFAMYRSMSNRYYIHATPTLFNAGTPRPQLSSCFLLTMDDSLDSIMGRVVSDVASISKHGGGIGINISSVRARGSYIRGSGGRSSGIIPMIRVYNNLALYVDQSGKRKGSIAIYLEPWHADTLDFLELRRPQGSEDTKARDINTALWIPDLLIRRAKEDKDWSFFCPDECPGLVDAFDDFEDPKFTRLYEQYEAEGKARKTIPAKDLIRLISVSRIESGFPYIMFKDHVNRKSNQKNLGTIRGSNLCTEIVEYTSNDEDAVCNLASMSLPAYIKDGKFDHDLFAQKVKEVVHNLNRVIDVNYYPTENTRRSNFRHRPVGIGYQGLADLFAILKLPFDSPEARTLNKEFAETLYYAALDASVDEAIVHGPYESYEGSPISKGIFQFEMWGVAPSLRYDWEVLRQRILTHGVRNSLLIAPMPTASTAQILGNHECFEPFTSNIFSRQTLSGSHIVLNQHLVRDLKEIGRWNDDFSRTLISAGGSIQDLDLPDDIKARYRTVWEISQKSILEMAADRAAFTCQTQSLNLYFQDPTPSKIGSSLIYAWELGLKTGCYYTRVPEASKAIAFTVDPVKRIAPNSVQKTSDPNLEIKEKNSTEEEVLLCSINNPDDCELCSG